MLDAVTKSLRLIGFKDVPTVTEKPGEPLVPEEQDWGAPTPPDGAAPCGVVPKAASQLVLALPSSQEGAASSQLAPGRVPKAPGVLALPAPPTQTKRGTDEQERSRSPQANRQRTAAPDAESTQAS